MGLGLALIGPYLMYNMYTSVYQVNSYRIPGYGRHGEFFFYKTFVAPSGKNDCLESLFVNATSL